MALTNDQLARKYKISPFGGINRSNLKGVYVLKINDASVYQDQVYNDVIHYTGQGLTGDQTLTRNNRGLATSDWPCHVWQKGEDGLYHCLGVYSVEYHYWARQDNRRVIMFKLVRNVSLSRSLIAFLLVILFVLFHPVTVSNVYARCTWDGSFCKGGNGTQTAHDCLLSIPQRFYQSGVSLFH